MSPGILLLALQVFPQPQPGCAPHPVDVARPVRVAFTQSAPSSLVAEVSNTRLPAARRLTALEELAGKDGSLSLEELGNVKRIARGGPALADYARCLGRCGQEGLEELHGLLKNRDPFVQAEAVYAIVRADAAGGEAFALDVLADRRRNAFARVAALRGLRDAGSSFARVEALRGLSTAEGPLLLEAIDTLDARPDPGDVPYLIDFVGRGDGMARTHAVGLLQKMTGYRIGPDARTWKHFYLQHQAEGTAFHREQDAGEVVPATLSYMGIPVTGNRVVFVLDSSGSMATPLPEQTSETRASRAIGELIALLPHLPSSARFDIVFFADRVSSYAKRMVGGTDSELVRVDEWLQRHLFDGGTNLFGGIEEAMRRQDVDEIFVLSDGQPNQGEVVAPRQILARVERWNRWRKVRINAISFGAPPGARSFLCRLAQENGGICRTIQ